MTFFGFSFHIYGLILGISGLVAIWLIEKKAVAVGLPKKALEPVFIWVLVAGIMGARLWHVATDWQLYQAQPLQVLFVWQGGLSILGAVAGGLVGIWLYRRQTQTSLSFWHISDLVVFGLPAGQVIGRLGNYVNQELYGLPSQLPWAIPIEPLYRLPGYESVVTYHPLFAYEMLAMSIFAVGSWWYSRRCQLDPQWRIGSGQWSICYVLYYCVIRFGLDFVRLDKAIVGSTGLGLNQLIIVVVFILVMAWKIIQLNNKKTYEQRT